MPAVARGSLEALVERVEAQVDGMPHDNGHALSWASLHHLPQGNSYHQKGVKQHEKHVRLHKEIEEI
jgi:hypothetical protein